MIGIVLVTHGRLAIEFRAALEHVVGAQEQIETVTIGPDDNVEQRRRDIIEAVKKVDSGDGVVILTDMFGGTTIMGLMMLAAGPGTSITVTATGNESAEVVAALETLVGERFGEEDWIPFPGKRKPIMT